MSALLSLPSNSTSFWRSPRRFAATTMYNIAISSTYIVQSRTTIATRTTLARCSDFPLPLHSLPEKHSSGFPASTLSGRFTKNSMSGTRPVNLLYEMFSTTRFCRPARYWRFPLRTFRPIHVITNFFCISCLLGAATFGEDGAISSSAFHCCHASVKLSYMKVLGTFITKWDEGKVVCDTLFSTKETAHMYAECLVELAVDLGFDGWLFIVDNAFFYAWIISDMMISQQFLYCCALCQKLTFMYDSVTLDGKLNWQDQVNEHNKPFFDICDGIFVNYTWKEDYPRLSTAVAGNWKFDVYMGIDKFVHGMIKVEVADTLDIAVKSVRYTRGSFIFRYNHKPLFAGGFDTESIEALEELRSRIHAPPGEDNNQKHS
ncbi:Cytosolic endo-beta-N-acetylglucosaminidase 2 [Glycine max]|nr:Cytosolic endo-beta-N-acetylglucosaminidase 2 [Glycine max]